MEYIVYYCNIRYYQAIFNSIKQVKFKQKKGRYVKLYKKFQAI